MERLILTRLQWVTGPLHPSVFAYSKESGTSESLATSLAHVSASRATAVFNDLEKAFELADEMVILSLFVAKGVGGRILQ